MVSALNSSVSAIKAAYKIQDASAHNVANSRTDGYKSLVPFVQEDMHGGVTVSISENPEPGPVYDKGNGEEAEHSNVNYATETVNQINARTMLAANIASLKTYEEMTESLIDIMA